MSFSFRDRPSLSERLRGRTGDQLLQDLEKEIEEDRKMFFDRGPGWNTTPRSGSFSRAFPFDDQPRRQDIRSHLEDLANRHPEFADHLRCPPWGGEIGAHSSRWDRKQPGTEFHRDDDSHSQASNSSSTGSDAPPSSSEKQGGLSHHGLRNTVDIGQQQHSSEQPKESRGQRSMSAPPPDSRSQGSEQAPQRFVTRLNITPSANAENARSDQGKPPVAPKQQPQQPSSPQQQEQPQQPLPKQSSGGNVRHIPIFVEGRDEPILPKHIGGHNYVPKPPQSHSFGRPAFNAHHFEPQPPRPETPPQSRKSRQQARPPQQPASQPPPPPSQQEQQHQHEQQQAPPKSKKPPANDPISRVGAVQKDVDELAIKVEQFSGTSRKDKDYIYLDEMLTRNLLKLDDIDTEGKDNVRIARKSAIKSINRCISILEGKVPLPDEPAAEAMEATEDGEPMESTTQLVESTEESGITSQDLELVGQDEETAADQSSGKVPDQAMEVENNESRSEQVCEGSAEKSDQMEVEQLNVVVDSKESNLMEVEPVKAMDNIEEQTMEVEGKLADSSAEETVESITSVVAGEKIDETVPEKQENLTNISENVADTSGGNANMAENELPVQDISETSAVEPKCDVTSEKSDVAASKPVQEVVNTHDVKAKEGKKGNESPRLKGKEAKGKKEGVKSRKGKAGKSAERKGGADAAKTEAEPVANDKVTEHSDTKAGDAGEESSDLDKTVTPVADAIPTA